MTRTKEQLQRRIQNLIEQRDDYKEDADSTRSYYREHTKYLRCEIDQLKEEILRLKISGNNEEQEIRQLKEDRRKLNNEIYLLNLKVTRTKEPFDYKVLKEKEIEFNLALDENIALTVQNNQLRQQIERLQYLVEQQKNDN